MTPADDPPAQFHFDPSTYEEMIREDVPLYDELQRRALDAIPFAPARILELGFGTAETTQRLLDRFPETRITGLDSSPEMVFKARELGWEDLRLGRMEDPLPDGPWDLVIGVLSIHHLDEEGKRELFRRVRSEARALVIGDVVAVPPERRVASLTEGWDYPSPAADQAEWCGGEVLWEADDLAVIRAVYDEGGER
jgi:tRNA (cmo5U34)-methyltransferase